MSNGRGPLIYAALSAVMQEYLQNYDCCVNGILEVSTEKDSRPNLAYSLVGDVLQIFFLYIYEYRTYKQI